MEKLFDRSTKEMDMAYDNQRKIAIVSAMIIIHTIGGFPGRLKNYGNRFK